MTFDTIQQSGERTLIYLAEIELSVCTRTFGVSPCLAEGAKCFNTSTTCKFKQAFARAPKIYKFCSSDCLNTPEGYRPYIQAVSFVASELKEDKTVPQLINLTLIDEPDSDIETDPYWSERGTIDGRGTFFKRLFARNANIKGRLLTLKQGFVGLPVSEFQTVAVCKISDYDDNNGTVTVKAEDLLKSLNEYKYPFRIPGVALGFDAPASFVVEGENGMLSCDAIKGDRCRRRDFGLISGLMLVPIGGGTLIPGEVYFYKIYAYDAFNNPIGYNSGATLLNEGETAVQIRFDNFAGGHHYRIYGRTETGRSYYQGNFGAGAYEQVTDTGGSFLNQTGDYALYKEYILTSDNPKDRAAWVQTITPETITLNSPTGLDASGYVKIENEIVYYASYVLINGDAVLQNVRRGLLGTEGSRHYAGAAIYYILHYAPGNPFTIAKDILTKGGVYGYADTAAINALESAWTGINFSCLPIAKDSDLGKIYLDLISMLNCRSWVNENGQITIKEIKAETPVHTITDEANIIQGSTKVDGNNKEIKTRITLYWDRADATKGANDKEGFARQTLSYDADAESDNEYGEELLKEIYTYWINSDCGTEAELNEYVNGLIGKKLKRLRDPKVLYTFDVELKDADKKLGEIVYLDSDDINSVTGANLDGHYCIVKREPKGNRITLTVQYFPERNPVIINIEPDILNTALKIKTTQSMPDEIETTGLEYFTGSGYTGGSNLNVKLGKIDIKLRWNNGYTRTDLTFKDVSGRSVTIADAAAHKKISGYNVYMFTANDNAATKKSAALRPSGTDANGLWQKIATIPDRHSDDSSYKYVYTIKNLRVGHYYDFFISQDMTQKGIIAVDEEVI